MTAPYFFTRADDAGEAVATGSYPELRGNCQYLAELET
jgi:hypothetical protein